MRKLSYYVYTNTDCTHYDSLDEAIEKYNSVEMKELKDSVFLGIESDDISPTGGVCFDVIHKFFKANILINDWINHSNEEDVKNVVKEIISHFSIAFQMTHDIFKGNCYSGTLIPFASDWIKPNPEESIDEKWIEAYVMDCSTGDLIAKGWQSNDCKTRETYGWSYREQACYVERLHVKIVDAKGCVSNRDIDPREYLAYHGLKFTDVMEFE